jgi:probable rRNA maturation factor
MPARRASPSRKVAKARTRPPAAALSARLIDRVARAVVEGEGRDASIQVTFLGPARMRRMNLQWKGTDRPTDVLSFSLPLPDKSLYGDVFICPDVARQQAKMLGIPEREELIRLIVHGTLHALGYDHPEGPGRTRSAMWRRQERYVRALA